MNKFLVLMGVLLILAGLFELSQQKDNWWVRSAQGLSIALAGIALARRGV